MKIKQKESVFNAIVNVLENSEQTIDGAVTLTKEQRAEVIEIVTVGIKEGEVDFSEDAAAKYDTFEKIKTGYVPGLVNNWLRKDSRLNGNVKYVAKNPGSRSGQGDDMLKNLKALRAQLVQLSSDADQIAAVDKEIDSRKATLATSKAKTIVVNPDLIPESLKHLIAK